VGTSQGTRAQRKADTRRRLLDAAAEVFLEQGPISPPLDLVAQRAGCSKATLFFHFPRRVDLISALARSLYEQQFADADPSPTGDVEAHLQAYLRAQHRPEVRLLWQLGDLMADGRTADLAEGYRYLVGQIRRVLVNAGLADAAAAERAEVITPALMLIGRRAALDEATDAELTRFVTAATKIALEPLA
jgi:AcrR family transcriptional regulator